MGMGSGRRDINLAMAFKPNVDPKVIGNTMVVKHFCKEIWEASYYPIITPTLPLGFIAQGIKSYLDNHHKPPQLVRGPISAAVMR